MSTSAKILYSRFHYISLPNISRLNLKQKNYRKTPRFEEAAEPKRVFSLLVKLAVKFPTSQSFMVKGK